MFKQRKKWLIIATVILLLLSLTSTQSEQQVHAGATDPLINEFVFNHTGSDTEAFIEIFGDPSTDYSAFTLLEIEGETTGIGVIDAVISLGTSDGNGFIVDTEDVENGTVTLLLVETFTGLLGDDLDTNDDGTLDTMPWTRVVDSVGVFDGTAGDFNYSTTVLAANFDGGSFTVGGASRIPNGFDSDSPSDWVRNDFDGAGIPALDPGTPVYGEAYNTPAATNEIVLPLLVINEIDYDQDGTDTAEYVEIYNADSVSIDLSNVILEFVNGSGGGAVTYDTITLSGTLAAGDFFVVCANAATVLNCDLDDSPDTNFIQNGAPDAVGLWLDSIGGSLLDAVSYEGSAGAPYTEGTGTTAADVNSTDTLSRLPDGNDTDSNNDDFMVLCLTPGETNSNCLLATDPLINEFVFNHTGTDTDAFVEILGDPSTDYSAFTLLVIEGDSGGTGNIDIINSAGTTDSNGYSVILSDVENNTESLLLVEGFTGALNDDIDGNDDGVIDNAPWTRIVDSIGVTDGDPGDFNYSTPALAANFDGGAFTVGGASRIPNGTDTDGTGDWVRNDFEGAGLPSFPGVIASPGEAINTPGADNQVQVAPPEACGDPATLISAIQGNSLASPEDGNDHSIEGVVVGDFQDTTTGLSGFFVQEEDTDADVDPLTSEGIFVYDPAFSTDVAVGDLVRVRGTVDEFFNLTELTSVQFVTICVGNPTATPATVTLPVSAVNDLERYEGMAVNFNQTLYATDHFNVGRFGEMSLSATDRLYIPTNVVEPGGPANALADQNLRSQILMDDGSNVEWPATVPYLGPDNTLRLGETVSGVSGVLSYAFSAYRLHPTASVVFDPAGNPRASTPVPSVGGNVKVASFNVLNYFTTIDNGVNGARGADNATEFTRQQTKIVDALADLNADVVGLIEIENNGATAVSNLVSALNAVVGAGTYDFIADPAVGLGSDAIKVAIIYKPAVVTPVGASQATLASPFDIRRPPVAQTFQHGATGEVFTFVVVHFKSKGCSGATGADTDQGDGQACYNAERVQASTTLKTWLATDPTSSGDTDFLVMGDFNAYVNEDPIDEMLLGGAYTSLVSDLPADDQYSYVFFGEAGALDNAFASTSLDSQVTGVGIWHINSDEPRALDYNDDVVDAGESTGNTPENQPYLYQPDQFRSSDHDAILVGLNFVSIATDTPVPPTDTPSGPVTLVASATCLNENLVVTISAGDGPFNITATGGGNTPVNGVGIGSHTINGPDKWDNLTVIETVDDFESINLGKFKCRTDERPVPLTPAHRSRTTNPFPLFSWTSISIANNYRVFVFDNKVAADRTVDIRQNSGGPTSMTLSTPLPDGRLFWRVRGRQNRVWSLWSIRFTLWKDPAPAIQGNTPVPTIELNPTTESSTAVPVPTQEQGTQEPSELPTPVPTDDPAPTFPPPPNSR